MPLTPQRKEDMPPHLTDLPERQALIRNYQGLVHFILESKKISEKYPELPHNKPLTF